MGFLDIAGVVAPIAGGLLGASQARRAGDVQARASDAAIAEQRRQFDLTRADLEPFRRQGVNGLNQFAGSVLGPLEETPGFRFQLEQGVNALERGASARGKLLSGQQAQALTRFGQGLGNLEVNNQLNRLAALSGIGQTSTAQGAAFGAGSAANIGNFLTNQGAARASGFVGASNAINDSINNALLFGALRGV